jgi:hypothetical protein
MECLPWSCVGGEANEEIAATYIHWSGGAAGPDAAAAAREKRS